VIEFLAQQLLALRDYFFTNFDPVRDVLDILVVSFAIYWLLMLIRGTRAVQMLVGLLLLMAARLLADWGDLATVDWILDEFLVSAVLIFVIIFQHDIRRALARMGRPLFTLGPQSQQAEILEEVVRAAQRLSQNAVGALMVLERENRVDDVVESGVGVDAIVTREILASIFQPSSPLHDGAALIQAGRLAQARCVLPLTQRAGLPEGVGTRHRAAVGLTEETDAVVVVVSEETGRISVSARGELFVDLDPPRLRDLLRDLMAADAQVPETVESGEPAEEPREGAPASGTPTTG
jgi:diadenylate cyclase